MQLTITGYSTALFSTWYFVEELGILFDCGDGVSAALLQKARKVEHVFISHADRDHLAGLLQFNQLLIHEATFLGGGEHIKSKPHVNKHSTLEAVMEMVSSIRVGKLVLGHFSSRYDSATIDEAILSYCNKYAINIPVYRVLPGITVTDILNQPALNA